MAAAAVDGVSGSPSGIDVRITTSTNLVDFPSATMSTPRIR
jgi:hypothetical protein